MSALHCAGVSRGRGLIYVTDPLQSMRVGVVLEYQLLAPLGPTAAPSVVPGLC